MANYTSGCGHSILLVEDNFAVQEVIRLSLVSAGYEVTCAGGGVEAERILDRERVDILLTDLVMADGDGLELINAARKKVPEQAIVAMSGGGEKGADLRLQIAEGLHVDGLLHKPFAMDELVSLIRTVSARSAS